MSAAFEKLDSVTAVKIGRIITTLNDPDPTSGEPQSAWVQIEVMMSDGSMRHINANVANHFNASVLSQLIAFVTAVRNKAIDEILPD